MEPLIFELANDSIAGYKHAVPEYVIIKCYVDYWFKSGIIIPCIIHNPVGD